MPTELTPAAGVNWFYGANGAGKTSVLEAIYLLGRGRSFRTGQVGAIIQHGQDNLQVVARLQDSGKTLGLERSRENWRGRIDGQDSRRISEFAVHLPLVLIEPDSHRLIDGGPEQRRQYLDWQLFHVEQDYLDAWQRYARLLRQRNAALKAQASGATLSALEAPMVAAAEIINAMRQQQIERLLPVVSSLRSAMAIRLPGEIGLRYRPGHPAEASLAESLVAQRDSDRERGFTQRGPHRAELVITSAGQQAAAESSRGQQKLLALLLLLAQLDILEQNAPARPVLLLDDPVSELDRPHLSSLLDWLANRRIQSWVTATEPPDREFAMFHVEQGEVNQTMTGSNALTPAP